MTDKDKEVMREACDRFRALHICPYPTPSALSESLQVETGVKTTEQVLGERVSLLEASLAVARDQIRKLDVENRLLRKQRVDPSPSFPSDPPIPSGCTTGGCRMCGEGE